VTEAPKLALDPSQERAVDLVCSAPFGIVTGGPGTGKSTCLRVALDRLDARGVKYELASPTGKAAKRLNETTGREARTIHRLLEFHPKFGWRRNAANPIDTDVVVVDESSMIDIELGAALLSAIDARRTRVILIGDADQLPPVGPGRLFGDLVDAKAVPLVRLQTLHRSAQESWIAISAPQMLRGELPDLDTRKDFRFVEVDDAKALLGQVEALALSARERDVVAQVLIPQRPGPAGIDAANVVLQGAMNPRGADDAHLARKKGELRIGDRVIQTKNDYDLSVFNGELGDVRSVSAGKVVVEFADRADPVTYTLEQAGALQLAYALTVHRSQGSEFPWVIAVVHSTHSFILTRQLLYTAVTRAKVGVVIVGDMKGLRHALKREPAKRNTTLIERLRGELEESEVA
jgi:exodeoxyribonuclease V alpha subunit